jgi:hypothetical protein
MRREEGLEGGKIGLQTVSVTLGIGIWTRGSHEPLAQARAKP